MTEGHPRVVVLAGPNGAGKTTTSKDLVRDQLNVVTNPQGHPAVTLPSDPREDAVAVTNAVVRAADALRRRNRLLGLPLVIWRAGRVQHVDAETLQPVSWPGRVGEGPLPLPPQS